MEAKFRGTIFFVYGTMLLEQSMPQALDNDLLH